MPLLPGTTYGTKVPAYVELLGSNAKVHKRHTMLSFHRVREAIAAGILGFFSYQEMITLLTSLVNAWDIHR
jgi:hypothetical protein